MKKLNDEQRKLIEDNYKLIRFLYRRSYIRVCSWEVFQGLGHEAMCKAALGYDPSKGKFTTYFTWKIKQAIEHYFRCNNYDVRKANDGAMSLYTPIEDCKKKEITILDTLQASDNIADTVTEEIYWEEKINKLPDKIKKMIQLTYEGYGREEVAKKLNVSRSLVSVRIIEFKKSMGYQKGEM